MFEDNLVPEITIEELADIHPSLYRLCDVRDEVSFRYGSIPGAVCMENILQMAEYGELDKSTSYVLYCMKGIDSLGIAYALRRLGYDAVSLKDGYSEWLMSSYDSDSDEKQKEVEKSIRKKFHKQLFTRLPRG